MRFSGVPIGLEGRQRLLETVRGERPADLFIRGGRIANVYSGELHEGNVAVADERIAYVGEGEQAIGPQTEVLDASGMIVSPGYVEAHCHPWVLYNPVSLAEGVLPRGTTTLVADNLFFYMQMGPDGFAAMADDLKELPLTYLWVVRLASQSRFPGEEELFRLERILSLLQRDDVVGTAEVTSWPSLAAGDRRLLEGIAAAEAEGKISDGHTGGASEARLAEVAAAGIDADHEAISREEALNRLRLGLWTMLRNSSLRPDLPELSRIVTEDGVSTQRLILTTDGPVPEHVAEHGYVDGLLRAAVENGIPPMQALQMVTINPATLYGLDGQLGGLAVGRQADLLLLPDLETFGPETVIARGQVVAEKGELLAPLPDVNWDRYESRPSFDERLDLDDPGLYPLRASGSEAELPTIHLESAVITSRKDLRVEVKDGLADLTNQPGTLHSALVDRKGNWISRALLSGFAANLDAMASTYNTAAQLLVLGRRLEAMALAARRVRELDGGIVIVREGDIVYELSLPIAGMMSECSFEEIVEENRKLSGTIAEAGYEFHDILYTLLFLVCDFLPAVRLTPTGLLDVKASKPLIPAEAPVPPGS